MNVLRLSVGRTYCRVVVIVGWWYLFLSVQVYTVCDAFLSPSSIGLPRRKVTTNSNRRGGSSSVSLVAILPAGAGGGGEGDTVSIYVVDPPSAPVASATTADAGMLDSVTSLDSAILSQYVLIGGVVLSISIVLAAIAFYASTSTSNDQQQDRSSLLTEEDEEEKKKRQDKNRRIDTTTTDINKSEAQRELAAMEAKWKNKVEGTAAELSSDTTAEETGSSNRVATTTTTGAIADDATNTRETSSSSVPAAPPQLLDSSSSEETTAKREKIEDNENDEDDIVVVVVDSDAKQQQPTQSGSRSLLRMIQNIRSTVQVTTKEIETNQQQLSEEKKSRIDTMSKVLLSSKATRQITDLNQRDERELMETIGKINTVSTQFERKKQQRRIVDIKLSKVSTTNSLLEEEYQDEQLSTQQLQTELITNQDTLLDTQNQLQIKQQELLSSKADIVDVQNKITVKSESLTELQDDERSVRTLGRKIWKLSKRRVSKRIPNIIKNRFRKRKPKKKETKSTTSKTAPPSLTLPSSSSSSSSSPLTTAATTTATEPDEESPSVSDNDNDVDKNDVVGNGTVDVEIVNTEGDTNNNKIVPPTVVPVVVGTNKRLFFNSLDTLDTLNVATQARTKLLQKMVDEKRIVDVKKTQQLIDNKENENDNDNEREMIILPTISYEQPGSIETFLATLPVAVSSSSSSLSSSSASSQSQPIAAGTWKVIYAPHMTTIANLLKGTLDVTYKLSADQTIVSHAYYDFPFVGTGYLSVSGTYGNVLTKTKSSKRSRTVMKNSSREEKTKARTSMRNINSDSDDDTDNRSSSSSYECCSKVDFDQVWIKSIGTTTKTVSDTNNDNSKQLPFEYLQEVPDSIMKTIINEVGQRAFLESFAVFPVSFLDSNTIVFEFELLGTKVCAHKIQNGRTK